MPDFNKGDFTQQGVAGHVNANLRLNEKRLVNIDLTSNEEAEGCTITGTVKDLLNDKVYGIGAGVSGNIEITENGENINVAPYATATVNVSGGGGGLPTCEITFTPSSDTDTIEFIEGSAYELVDTYLTDLLGINETTTKNIPYYDFSGTYVAFMFTIVGTTFTATDEVNCQLQGARVVITDPSLPSSITLTGSSPK